MDYRAKMIEHLEKAEVINARIDHWENWAEKTILKNRADELSQFPAGNGRDEMKLYMIKDMLEKRLVYRNLINTRNLNLEWAKAYGIAAIASQDNRSGDLAIHADPRLIP